MAIILARRRPTNPTRGWHAISDVVFVWSTVLGLCIAPAAAQGPTKDWPTRFVTVVVPFGAGSGTDTVARIIGARMSEELGQQVIIENVGGAGGMIGVSRVAKAAPDGYTLVMGAVDTFAQNQSLYANPQYDAAKDFSPVALAVEQPLILIARKEIPAANLQEFAAHLKANPGRMQFGSSGIGSAPHLACFQIVTAVGADVAHVPYRGSAPALQDMLAGNLDFYCPLAASATPLIEGKSVKALAMLTRERSALMPDLPTAAEQGIAAVDGYYWMGFFLPKGAPDAIVARLGASINVALDTPAVQTRLREVGTTVVAPARRSPAALQAFVESEIEKWAATIKANGIKLN